METRRLTGRAEYVNAPPFLLFTVATTLTIGAMHCCARISTFWPARRFETVPFTVTPLPYGSVLGAASTATLAGAFFTVTVARLSPFSSSVTVNVPA